MWTVDRRRNFIGNAFGEKRVKEMEKLNKSSPVYSVSSLNGQKFEIYNPNLNKGRRIKPVGFIR